MLIACLVLCLISAIGVAFWHLVDVCYVFTNFIQRKSEFAALWSGDGLHAYLDGISNFVQHCPDVFGPVCGPQMILLRFLSVPNASFFQSRCEAKVQWLFHSVRDPGHTSKLICSENNSVLIFRNLESLLTSLVLTSESNFVNSSLSAASLKFLSLVAVLTLLFFLLFPSVTAIRSFSAKSNLIGDFTAILEEQRETQKFILSRRFPIANPNDVEGCVQALEPRNFAAATVMTYQVCRLREIAANLSTNDFVELINTLSSWIDERLRLYRVFTMTDCHNFGVVYSGVFDNGQQDKFDVANLSLDLQNFCADLCISSLPLELQKVQMKIGIDTGPVRGGILKRAEASRYFVIGWACQISKELHAKAPDGCILISRRTYNQLKKTFLYNIKPYKTVRYCGEKKMMTYLLSGIEVVSISYSSLDDSRKNSFFRSTTMTHNMLMERNPVFSEDEILDSVTPRLIEHFYHMRGDARSDGTALPSTSRCWEHSFDASSSRTSTS